MPHQAKQLATGLDHATQGRAPAGNGAIVRRPDLGLLQADLLGLELGLGGGQIGSRRFLRHQVLLGLLFRHTGLAGQFPGAGAVGARLGQGRLRLGDPRLLQRHVCQDRILGQFRQHLAPLDLAAHVHGDPHHPQTAGFGGDDRLLPGRQAAVGTHQQGPVLQARLFRGDGKGRRTLPRRAVGQGAGGAQGQEPQAKP